jgi:hypothetical protein
MKILSVLASRIIQPFTTLRATTAFILGTADTSGVRLDMEAGVLAVREGDDSAYGDIIARVLTATLGVEAGSFSTAAGTGRFNIQSRLTQSSTADGNARWTNWAETNTYDITLADWGTTLSAEAVSTPNTTITFIGAAVSGSLHVSLAGESAIFLLRGTANATTLSSGAAATFTVTKATGSRYNVFYDAAGASGAGYYAENLLGSTQVPRLALIGG